MSDAKTIFRTKLSRDFTTLPNALLRNKTMSYKARGILAMVLTHHEEWVVNNGWLQSQGTEGKEAIKSAMQELEAAGHVVFESLPRRDAGHFGGGTWIFHDTPVPESQRTNITRHTASRMPVTQTPVNRMPDCHTLQKEHGKEELKTEETVTETPARAESVETVITGQDHAELIAWWCLDYERRINAKYKVTGGRDGKAAKQLLQHFKSLDASQIFITACLNRQTEFPFKGMVGTLHRFAENISTFQAALATAPRSRNGHTHRSGATQPTHDDEGPL